MPCLLGCFALLAPRLAIVLIVIFSDYIGRANETILWPLLGFFFLPLTTLAYAWSINEYGEVQGLGLVLIIVAVLIDLGSGARSTKDGGGFLRRRSKRG